MRRFGVALDFGRLVPATAPVDALRAAVLEHGFVVLRDQRLTDQELLAFGRRFGMIDERIVKYSTVGPSARQAPSGWHHHSHCDRALEEWLLYYTPAMPSTGGDLELFDAQSWFARLAPGDRAWARERSARHDYTGVAHAGIAPVAQPDRHPLVMRRGPHEALYVGAHAVAIDGVESLAEPLPGSPWQRIRAAGEDPVLQHLHAGRAHDLLIWDLKMVSHRGHPFASRELRVIHEVAIRRLA